MEKPSRSSESNLESVRHLKEGEQLSIAGVEHTIEKVEDAAEVAAKFNLKLDRDIPIYYLKGMSASAQGGYHPKADIIVVFENNTDPTTLEHELVHAVEYKFEPTPALLALFEKAKEVIEEGDFENLVNFNFTRNIHEFIAEGKTKLAPILKKKGLYEDFERETAYIFD